MPPPPTESELESIALPPSYSDVIGQLQNGMSESTNQIVPISNNDNFTTNTEDDNNNKGEIKLQDICILDRNIVNLLIYFHVNFVHIGIALCIYILYLLYI